ncbi:unnamed protein product [Blepharisma stoltei]|uniref:Acetyl-CoA acetyltransferase n=1 Tax=Blepharisma stoltei TaxID=1481888 RepID=A0AAU9K1W7_9CILI|nr:unnamed protein product [Blepharisma stoltei]
MRRLHLINKHLCGEREVCIVAAGRSPIDKVGGSLSHYSTVELASSTLKGTLEKFRIPTEEIEEIYFGTVFPSNLGQSPAKQIAVNAGLRDSVNCMILNKLCASGMKATMLGALSISTGNADCVVVGGAESMSKIPYIVPKIREGLVRGNHKALDATVCDGILDPRFKVIPAFCSDLISQKLNFSKSDLDYFSQESIKRANKAWNSGKFSNEIIPISDKKGKLINKDTIKDINLLKADLKPIYQGGVTTAANACPINDGTSFLVLCSRQKANALGLKILGTISSFADFEHHKLSFPTSPTLAIWKALERANLSLSKIDYIEINEAFASVVLANSVALPFDLEKINVYGGGVAIGHPVGSSGARILVTLLNVLMQEGGVYGAAGICNDGGGAGAVIIKREI